MNLSIQSSQLESYQKLNDMIISLRTKRYPSIVSSRYEMNQILRSLIEKIDVIISRNPTSSYGFIKEQLSSIRNSPNYEEVALLTDRVISALSQDARLQPAMESDVCEKLVKIAVKVRELNASEGFATEKLMWLARSGCSTQVLAIMKEKRADFCDRDRVYVAIIADLVGEGADFCNEVDKILSWIDDKNRRSEAICFIVEAYANKGEIDGAIRDFESIKDYSSFAQANANAAIALALAKANRLDEALRRLDGMEFVVQADIAYEKIADGLLKKGKITEAVSVAEGMNSPKEKCKVFEQIINRSDNPELVGSLRNKVQSIREEARKNCPYRFPLRDDSENEVKYIEGDPPNFLRAQVNSP